MEQLINACVIAEKQAINLLKSMHDNHAAYTRTSANGTVSNIAAKGTPKENASNHLRGSGWHEYPIGDVFGKHTKTGGVLQAWVHNDGKVTVNHHDKPEHKVKMTTKPKQTVKFDDADSATKWGRDK